jgi:hypothetical protein
MASEGGCQCGAVRFRVAPAPRQVWFCHCRQCRRAQGSAFVASVPVPRGEFELLSGEQALRAWRSSPGKSRWFCGVCGSPLYSEVDGAGTLRVRAGALDDDVTLTPAGHIFVADRASWHAIGDELPRHAGREPGR